MEYIILSIFMGLWRVWDGRGAEWWPYVNESRYRIIPMILITGYVSWSVVPDLWFILAWLLSAWSLQRGFGGDGTWEDLRRSIQHWTFPALVTVFVLLWVGTLSNMAYPLWCLIPGIIYPANIWVQGRLKPRHGSKWWFGRLGYLNEFAAGTCVIFGLSTL